MKFDFLKRTRPKERAAAAAVSGILRSSIDLITPSIGVFDRPQVQWSEVIPYATAPDWFLSSVNTVIRLAALPTGWDSYGSPPVTAEAKAHALKVLTLLGPQRASSPHIGPVPGGGLQMEWSNGPRALELEVRPDGTLEFLRVYDDDTMKEGQIPWDRADYLREQVNWLQSPH